MLFCGRSAVSWDDWRSLLLSENSLGIINSGVTVLLTTVMEEGMEKSVPTSSVPTHFRFFEDMTGVLSTMDALDGNGGLA